MSQCRHRVMWNLMTTDGAAHLSPPHPDDTAAVGPRLLIRQALPCLLSSQLTSISGGRSTIRHLWTRGVAVQLCLLVTKLPSPGWVSCSRKNSGVITLTDRQTNRQTHKHTLLKTMSLSPCYHWVGGKESYRKILRFYVVMLLQRHVTNNKISP